MLQIRSSSAASTSPRSDREVRLRQVREHVLLHDGDRESCNAGTDSRIRALIWAGAWHPPTLSRVPAGRALAHVGMCYGCVAVHHGERKVRDHGLTIMWRLRSPHHTVPRRVGVISQKS